VQKIPPDLSGHLQTLRVQTRVRPTARREQPRLRPDRLSEAAVNFRLRTLDAFRFIDAPFRDMSATGLSGSGGSSTDEEEQHVEHHTVAPLLLTVPEAARVLAIGRTTLYELISSGAIETVHIGRAIRIPVESARAFVENRRSSH